MYGRGRHRGQAPDLQAQEEGLRAVAQVLQQSATRRALAQIWGRDGPSAAPPPPACAPPPASRGHRAQEATVDLPSRKGESRKKGQRPDERGLEGGEPLREGQGGPGRHPESPRLRLAGWQEQSGTREACGRDAPGAATPDCCRRTDAHRAKAGCRGPGRRLAGKAEPQATSSPKTHINKRPRICS